MTDEALKANFTFPSDFISRLIDLTSKEKWVNQKRHNVEQLFQNCGSAAEASVVMHTLEVFEYIDGDRLSIALQSIADKIITEWKLKSEDTRIVCRDIEGKTDSSAALQQMVKPLFYAHNGWSSNKNFPSGIEKVIKSETVNNIVLVDDFSGTGKSLEKLCIWIDKKCSDIGRSKINVYACFIAAMNSTITRTYNGVLKDIYHYVDAKKGISIHFPNDGELEKKHMISFERRYGNISKSYSLGFEKSEAVFHVQNLNTPNNVLPIFWKKGKYSSPLFPRIGKENGN